MVCLTVFKLVVSPHSAPDGYTTPEELILYPYNNVISTDIQTELFSLFIVLWKLAPSNDANAAEDPFERADNSRDA